MDEPLGYVMEPTDYRILQQVMHRLFDYKILSPDERRDLANTMHVVLNLVMPWEEPTGEIWVQKHPQANPEMIGAIPYFLNEDDERGAVEQFRVKYVGGWHPLPNFTMLPNGNLKYPGDPITHLLYETKLRDEIIRVYEHAWVAVIQPDGSFEVSRMD